MGHLPQMSYFHPSPIQQPIPTPSPAMTSYESVGVFWDYGQLVLVVPRVPKTEVEIENCPPSAGASGYNIVDNIRVLANQFGAVNVAKAYLQLPDKSSPRQFSLRSELQSCGLSLTGPFITPAHLTSSLTGTPQTVPTMERTLLT